MADADYTNEKWLPVVGWEGIYEVSDYGRVRSLDRTIYMLDGRVQFRAGRVLRPSRCSRGRDYVVLCKIGDHGREQRTQCVARLVARAFIGEPSTGDVVRHFDDDPTNNRPENLLYGSQSENMHDAVRNGRNHHANKTHCIRGHEFTPENTLIQKGKNRRCRECKYIEAREYRQRVKLRNVA